MLINAADPNRVGFEVEMRTFQFNDRAVQQNGILLAQCAFNIVDGGLNYNFLRILSEGEGSGTLHPELVFGPVRFNEIRFVKQIIEAAKNILIPPDKLFGTWVNQLNVELAKISPNHRLTCINPYQNTKIKAQRGVVGTVSMQANIAVRLDSLTSELFDRWFEGNIYHETAYFSNIRNQLPPNIQNTDLGGAALLIIFSCAVTGKLRKAMTAADINKQFFHILPKTSLKQLFTDLPAHAALTPANVAAILNNIVAANKLNFQGLDGAARQQFYTNMAFTATHITTTPPAAMLHLHPRPSAVLDTMTNGVVPFVILEMRKSAMIERVYNSHIRLTAQGVVEIER